MRIFLPIALALTMVSAAAALDTGNRMPAKPATPIIPNIPDPDRQGGDTFATVAVIPALPFNTTGTTTGFTNDYDEYCPHGGSNSPDVVYSFECAGEMAITVDLCGSAYDTKTYIFDAAYQMIACNDDFYFDATCGYYTSCIEDAICSGLIYIVIDGYGGDHGDYILAVTGGPNIPCVLECPAGGYAEGEPALVDDYYDDYNGGCNTPGYPFQDLYGDSTGNLTLCGVSGWYLYHGHPYRDTDWFYVHLGSVDLVEIRADAEQPMWVMAIPHDCNIPAVNWMITPGDCQEDVITFDEYLPYVDWVVIVPSVFAAPPGAENEFDYVVWFSGLESGVATARSTWGTVKVLFE